jgi:hypothetical protein
MAKKTDDLDKLAEDFIKKCGSKAEAHRRIKASKAKGKPSGRPPKHFLTDAQMLFEVEVLAYARRRAGVKPPERLALLKEIISREIADGKQVGTKKNATQRIKRYSHPLEPLEIEGSKADVDNLREFWTDEARRLCLMAPSARSERFLKFVLNSSPSLLIDFTRYVAIYVLEKKFERKYSRRMIRARKQVALAKE